MELVSLFQGISGLCGQAELQQEGAHLHPTGERGQNDHGSIGVVVAEWEAQPEVPGRR